MPITFPCSSCGKTLSVPATAVGKSARCPECQNLMPVTAASGDQAPPPAAAPTSAVTDKEAKGPASPTKEQARKRGKKAKQKGPDSKVLVAVVGGLIALGVLGVVIVGVAAWYVLKSDEPAPAPAAAAAPAASPVASATIREQKPLVESPPPRIAYSGPEISNLSTVQAEKRASAFTVRGDCEMAAIFTADFKPAKDTHVCIRLRQATPFASILCYAPRDSEDGKKLIEIFGKGEKRVMMLECELGHESPNVAKLIRIIEYFGAAGLAMSGPARYAFVDQSNTSPSYWFVLLCDSNSTSAATARDRLKSLGAAAMPELRRVLFDTDPRVRVALASLLGEMGENAHPAVDDLARSLGDDEAPVRAAAAKSLGKLGAAAHSALLALVMTSADTDSAASAAAMAAIPLVGPVTVADVDKLLTLWKQTDAAKRERCVGTLRGLKLDAETATRLFSPLLADKDSSLRVKAIQALGDAGPSAHDRLFAKLLAWAADDDASIRQATLEALAKLGPAVGTDYQGLAAGLKYKPLESRAFCVERLADLAEAAAPSAPEVMRLAHDDDPKLRAASLRTLTRIAKSSPDTLTEVLKAVRDQELAVRLTAAELLSQFGREKRVVEALFAGLGDESPEMRAASIKALSGMDPHLGRDEQVFLCKALKSNQVEVRRFAAAEFARMGGDAADSLTDIIADANDGDFEARRSIFAALAAHGAKAAAAAPVVQNTISEIVQADAKQEGAPELLTQASATLAKLGSAEKAVPVLAGGLKSDKAELRKVVIRALAEIGPPARTLAKDLCALLSDTELASQVSDAILKIRGEEVVKALCDIAEYDRSVPTKVAAIEVLGKMGADAKGAYQTLVGLVRRNKGKEVGNAASEALKLIH